MIFVALEEFDNNTFLDNNINIIRCASHTLQLIVYDFLKLYELNVYVVKKIIKKLRTPEYRRILKINNISIPLLDNQTRWSSKYLLYIHLFKLKDFIINQEAFDKDLHLSLNDWDVALEIKNILYIFYKENINLQKEQMTLSDFYISWLNIETELQDIKNSNNDNLLKYQAIEIFNIME